MSLSSSSTVADALAQYNNNLRWHGSVTVATNLLEAIDWIIGNRGQVIAANDRTINFESLQNKSTEISTFLNKFGANVNRASFTRGHMLK